MSKPSTPLTCHDGSSVVQSHITVVNSVIAAFWLEISGAVMKGGDHQVLPKLDKGICLCFMPGGRGVQQNWCVCVGGVAVLLLMLFGFESRQEFCFIRA